jgi:hypothetical protein
MKSHFANIEPASTSFYGIPVNAVSMAADNSDFAGAQTEVLDFLRPKSCPLELIRIGGKHDGAYLIPRDLAGVAACFSPGVKNKKSFEDELATSHGIPSFMCDKSSDVAQFATPLIEGRQSFRKVWLDTANSEDAVTLETWVAEEMSAPGDLLLQMDIEGAEYRILLAAQPDLLRRFRIMALEFHGLQKMNDPSVLFGVMLPIVRKLAADFVCVHAHANNGSTQFRARPTGVACPRLLEVTLLRKDRFPAKTPSRGKVLIPHPLDIPRNARGKPPLFLEDWWLGGAERPLESQLKMAQDEIAFLRYLLKEQGTKTPS